MDGVANLTGAQKGELMDQVKQQIAVANAQELLTVSFIEVQVLSFQLRSFAEND